jgi:threonylcarbamoyladenosine tRNA methylthiotransferase MtaB
LRDAAQAQLKNWLSRQHGKTMSVLIENPGQGRAENFARVQIDASHESGTLVDVTIHGDNGLMLLGGVK